MSATAYDVIGDIHGHADKLTGLLRAMGYRETQGVWRPPHGHQAVFIGDLIDRGPEQRQVIRIVRSMMDAGHARAVMGNHEFNAIGFVTPDPGKAGQFLRPHSDKNRNQHGEFLAQVGEGSDLHREYIEWFRTLPVTLDLGGIRAVHACWHDRHIGVIASDTDGGRLSEDFIVRAHRKGSPEHAAMDCLTKGVEIPLPEGASFVDHADIRRTDVRTRWWLEAPATFRDVAVVEAEKREQIPAVALPGDYCPLPVHGTPVFVGHYWLEGAPSLQAPRVACVDYSAAGKGPLVAYRWMGETELDARNFVLAGGA